jgi:tetratricopeptide (TPR) repeat protein
MNHLRKVVLIAAGFNLLAGILAMGAGADRWQSLVDAGNAASRKRDIVAAKKYYDQALREAERNGFDDPRVGKTFKLIGDLYFSQEQYDEAKPYYARAEALESTGANLKTSETELATGSFAGAKQVAQMVLTNLERELGRQDALLTPALIARARAERALLQQAETEATLNRAMKILQLAAPESREMASALDLRGQLLDDQNKYADAEPLLKRALVMRQKLLDADDPQLEVSFEHLAEHYRKTGGTADAEAFQKQADAIQGKALLNLRDYVDKENGFRLRIPNVWSNSSELSSLQVPGGLATFQSSDESNGVLVQRLPVPSGADSSALYDSFGQTAAATGGSEDVGEENATLSALPARRIRLRITFGQRRLLDWATLLVTSDQFWVLHVVGPEGAMSSPDAPYYKAARSIEDSFAFLEPVQQVIKARAIAPPPPLQTVTGEAGQCRHYQNREVAMQIILPDGWRESAQGAPSYREGKIVVLNRTGTMAVVVLGREELEASPELYLKTLQNSFQEATENFQKISEEKIVRQGNSGTRTVLVTREGGIDYRSIMEVFSIGNEHFRVVARAPTEVFDRYASVFDAMIESVQILPVAGQPPTDNPVPPAPK